MNNEEKNYKMLYENLKNLCTDFSNSVSKLEYEQLVRDFYKDIDKLNFLNYPDIAYNIRYSELSEDTKNELGSYMKFCVSEKIDGMDTEKLNLESLKSDLENWFRKC